jgi:putative hydrolase of the HAD superfamily
MATTHLVFDLDDTLYPERQWALGGFAAAGDYARRIWGVEGVGERLTALLDAGHLGAAFKIALTEAKPDHTDDDLKAMVSAFGAHAASLALFDDAARALDRYAGHSLGLITDGHDKTQAKKIGALALSPRFASIVLTGALGPDRAFHKPHPKAFEMTQHAMRRSANDRFVYIGDNPAKDFIAPNAMGWLTVLVDRPAHRGTRIHKLVEPPPEGEPQVTVDSLDDLDRAIASHQ